MMPSEEHQKQSHSGTRNQNENREQRQLQIEQQHNQLQQAGGFQTLVASQQEEERSLLNGCNSTTLERLAGGQNGPAANELQVEAAPNGQSMRVQASLKREHTLYHLQRNSYSKEHQEHQHRQHLDQNQQQQQAQLQQQQAICTTDANTVALRQQQQQQQRQNDTQSQNQAQSHSSNGSTSDSSMSSSSGSSSSPGASSSCESSTGGSTTSSSSSNVTAFLSKLWRMVNDQANSDLIRWSQSGCSFVILNQIQFAKDLLPLYFKHSNMASFIRQLNMYGFRKIPLIGSDGSSDQRMDVAQFYHMNFMRDQEQRLSSIKRKNNSCKTHNLTVNGSFCDEVRSILSDVKSIRDGQNSSESILGAIQLDNKSLWRDVAILRNQHHKQRRVIEKLIQFLVSLIQNRNNIVKKRKVKLMIEPNMDISTIADGVATTGDAALPDSHLDSLSPLNGETAGGDLLSPDGSPMILSNGIHSLANDGSPMDSDSDGGGAAGSSGMAAGQRNPQDPLGEHQLGLAGLNDLMGVATLGPAHTALQFMASGQQQQQEGAGSGSAQQFASSLCQAAPAATTMDQMGEHQLQNEPNHQHQHQQYPAHSLGATIQMTTAGSVATTSANSMSSAASGAKAGAGAGAAGANSLSPLSPANSLRAHHKAGANRATPTLQLPITKPAANLSANGANGTPNGDPNHLTGQQRQYQQHQLAATHQNGAHTPPASSSSWPQYQQRVLQVAGGRGGGSGGGGNSPSSGSSAAAAAAVAAAAGQQHLQQLHQQQRQQQRAAQLATNNANCQQWSNSNGLAAALYHHSDGPLGRMDNSNTRPNGSPAMQMYQQLGYSSNNNNNNTTTTNQNNSNNHNHNHHHHHNQNNQNNHNNHSLHLHHHQHHLHNNIHHSQQHPQVLQQHHLSTNNLQNANAFS